MLGLLLEQVVQVVHVSAMMPAIVEVEEVARDDWLERAKLIWQLLQLNT